MRSTPSARHQATSLVVRVFFVVPVVLLLLAGILGGLLRAGAGVPGLSGAWLGQAIATHAFLMICAFMGTVIAIERAVAVKARWAFAAPLASAASGIALLSGAGDAAKWLALAASVAFVGVNVVVVLRQRAAHTTLLLVGALAWAAGTGLYGLGAPSVAVIPWWFAFLLLTIAAERLEMTRLMRRREGASTALFGIVVALLLGAAVSGFSPLYGGMLFGLSLVYLAVWLLAFDIARRTVRSQGLSRYMAVCLLLGYAWLLAAGIAWIGMAQGMAVTDVALHALGLGFVFSMMLGHAPVILPAIARLKVLFGWWYYAPLALLHASLIVRLAWGRFDLAALAAGAMGNALAILLFALTVGGSAVAWRLRHSSPRLDEQLKTHHETTA